MTYGYGMQVADRETGQPRRIGRGHSRSHHLRDMTVYIVPEQRRRILGHHAEPAVWKKARLDESLEAVADTENQTSAVDKGMYGFRYFSVIQNIRYKLAASVRFVSGRKASDQCQYVALGNILLHLLDGAENILAAEIAEHAHTDFRTCLAECLGSIVVAVRTREYRDIDCRSFDRSTLVLHLRLLDFQRFHSFKSGRDEFLVRRLAGIGIDFGKSGSVGVHQLENGHADAVYAEVSVFSGSHFADIHGIRPVELCF